MPYFYGDVEVIERRRVRVQFEAKKKPTKKQMLGILKDNAYENITDEECLEHKEVLKVDVEEMDSSKEVIE
jgi:hypothetical protein